MGYPIEIPEVPVPAAGAWPLLRDARRRCLGCGYELVGPLADRLTDCPQCRREFSIWALPEVRPLPVWLMTAWGLGPALLPAGLPGLESVAGAEPVPAWVLPAAGVLMLYFWGCRILRERRVPLRGLFAVPIALAMALPVGLLGALVLFCVLSGRPEAPVVIGTSVAAPMYAALYWALRRERPSAE